MHRRFPFLLPCSQAPPAPPGNTDRRLCLREAVKTRSPRRIVRDATRRSLGTVRSQAEPGNEIEGIQSGDASPHSKNKGSEPYEELTAAMANEDVTHATMAAHSCDAYKRDDTQLYGNLHSPTDPIGLSKLTRANSTNQRANRVCPSQIANLPLQPRAKSREGICRAS
jgi:hypothetical protein